jgi:serine/threonine protein kinase/tetratricopeptide (TPR) repeat protein
MIGDSIGKYEILEALGAGGMGRVFRARDPSLGREVALKLLPPEVAGNAHRLSLFKEEAKAVAALDHPNIVTIYSVDEVDGMHFLTMELVRGKTLDQHISPGGVTLDRLFRFAIPIVQAVSAAHGRGIVHRDLKPANIMVSDTGVVKILDFGLAKTLHRKPSDSEGEPSTDTLPADRLAGTVPYMAPEQLEGRKADERSDLFSLGVILFELSTGCRPFLGSNNDEIAASIYRDAPPSIEDARPDLPHHLSRIVGRCLRKDPRRRWQTARDLGNELEDLAQEIAGRSATVVAEETGPSVAVLPFLDMSEKGDQGHFADGLAEDLINAFSQIHGVQVPARTSSFSFRGRSLDVREIGRRLRVASVLEGSVQKHGERLRVTASLIQTETGYTLWSQSFDRQIDDIFQIQDEITRSIITELEVPLRGEEQDLLARRADRRVDQKVYDLHLQARKAWADRFEGRLKEALQKFQQVAQLEPDWAPAYSGLADCYTVLGWYTYLPSKAAFGAAGKFVQRALELDPSDADAHASEALIQTLYHWDWQAAEHHFSESIRLRPNNPVVRWWYSFLLVVLGRIEEALEQGQHARTREDPFSRAIHANIGWLQHLAGDAPAALAQLEATAETWPDFALTYVFLGWVRERLGDLDGAIEAWKTGQREFSRLGTAMPSLALQEAHTLALQGKSAESHAILADCDAKAALPEPVYYSPTNRAAVHVALGEIDRTLEWLERAEEAHDCWLLVLQSDPRFGPLREVRGEELEQLAGRVGLPRVG